MEKRLEYRPKDSGIMFVLSLFVPAIFVLLVATIIKLVFPNISDKAYNYISLALNQIGFLLLFVMYNKLTKTDSYSANKIKFNLNIWQILICIAVGIVALYGFNYLVSYLEWILTKNGYVSSSFSFLDVSNFGVFFASTIVVCVLPAICEELIFRGVILNGYKKYGKTLMIIFSGLLFSLMHLSIEQSIYQFVLGMVMACVVMTTGTIVSSMITHFFNNFLIIFLAFLTRNSTSTSSEIWAPVTIFDHIKPFLYAIMSVIIILGLLVLLKKCTKNPEYDLFNFKKQAKDKISANIDNNGENALFENSNAQDVDNIVETEQTQTSEQAQASQNERIKQAIYENNENSSDKFFTICAFVVGIAMWLISVGVDLITNIK